MNGKFPGPRVVAREGDRLVVKVVNHVSNNVSLHWYEFLILSILIISTLCTTIREMNIEFRINVFTLTVKIKMLITNMTKKSASCLTLTLAT